MWRSLEVCLWRSLSLVVDAIVSPREKHSPMCSRSQTAQSSTGSSSPHHQSLVCVLYATGWHATRLKAMAASKGRFGRPNPTSDAKPERDTRSIYSLAPRGDHKGIVWYKQVVVTGNDGRAGLCGIRPTEASACPHNMTISCIRDSLVVSLLR